MNKNQLPYVQILSSRRRDPMTGFFLAITAFLLFLAVFMVFAGSAEASDDFSDWENRIVDIDAYYEDDLCFTPIDGVYGNYLQALDFDEVPTGTLNAGTTSIGFAPCVPTPEACAAVGMVFISGNVCSVEYADAFNAIPEGPPARLSSIDAPATVGPIGYTLWILPTGQEILVEDFTPELEVAYVA